MHFSEADYSVFTLEDFAAREANSLHESAFKPTRKLSDLTVGTKYDIYNIRKVTTKWGDRVVADLGEYKVFLPGRYSNLSSNSLLAMAEGGYAFEITRPIGSTYELKFVKLK